MNNSPKHITHDLVMVGAGHAQVAMIRRLAMSPVGGLRATLINDARRTPYSGMLPGAIAGHYNEDQLYIDLDQLCGAADVEFIEGRAVGIDPTAKVVTLEGGVQVRGDTLSLNPGGAPIPILGPGSGDQQPDWLLVAKPIGAFWHQWQRWRAQAEKDPGEAKSGEAKSKQILIVGGGAAGVELAFAIQASLDTSPNTRGLYKVVLAGSSDLPLPSLGRAAGRKVERELAACGVDYWRNQSVELDHNGPIVNGQTHDAALVVWAAGVSAPSWLASCGLECDDQGFARVDATLQSVSHPGVFVSGDAVDFAPKPLPKAGVYSVRMGPVLAENLVRRARGRRLQEYKPQANTLFLLGNARGKALGWYAGQSGWARWLWRWKDRIDRTFMARFGDDMTRHKGQMVARLERETGQEMRCEGCAAKVKAPGLSRALGALDIDLSTDAGILEDALDSGTRWVQSVDAITSPLNDPYLHGYIAVIHALSDVYISGSLPKGARGRPKLAIQVTVGRGNASNEAARLGLIMQGVMAAARAEGADIVTGHSATGDADMVSVTVTGRVSVIQASKIANYQGRLDIYLSKPLGIGALLAARRLGLAHAGQTGRAIEVMKSSNRMASELLLAKGAVAMTDVTGFGLVNHLADILPQDHRGHNTHQAQIRVDDVPTIMDFDAPSGELVPAVRSSLFASNAAQAGFHGPSLTDAQALLFDPQTSGGVLALVPAVNEDDCADLLGHGIVKVGDVLPTQMPLHVPVSSDDNSAGQKVRLL